MAFIVKRKPVDYQALESKTYPARLVGVVGIGEQEVEYTGNSSPSPRQLGKNASGA